MTAQQAGVCYQAGTGHDRRCHEKIKVRDTSTASQAGKRPQHRRTGTWGAVGSICAGGLHAVTLCCSPHRPNKIRHRGLTVLQGWQLWNVGNIAAGKNQEPVGPYRELLPWGFMDPRSASQRHVEFSVCSPTSSRPG